MLYFDQHCGMDGTTHILALLCVFSDNSTPEFLQLLDPQQEPQFSIFSRYGSCSSPKTTAVSRETSAAAELMNMKHDYDDCPVHLEARDCEYRDETAMTTNCLR
jgi:uncharacterized protein YneR